MESKKNNYKKPAMRVLEIQYRGHLLGEYASDGPQNAREQNSNWSSED